MSHKINLILTVLLAVSATGHAISPFFSSDYFGLQNTIERFASCRAFPISGSTNASDHLIKTVNSFLDRANFSYDSLENAKEFVDEISLRKNYTVSHDLARYVNSTDKNGRCDLLELVMDTAYPLLRHSAYNRSVTLNLTGAQIESPMNGTVRIPLTELINTLWVSGNFTLDDMNTIGAQVVQHLNELQRSMSSDAASMATRRAGLVADDVPACCSYRDWLNYHIDSLLSMVTRFRLGLSTRTTESRMAITGKFSSAKQKLFSYFQRSSPPSLAPSSSPPVPPSNAPVSSLSAPVPLSSIVAGNTVVTQSALIVEAPVVPVNNVVSPTVSTLDGPANVPAAQNAMPEVLPVAVPVTLANRTQ